MLASRVSRMRRGVERIRDLTAAQQDEAPIYEAPAAELHLAVVVSRVTVCGKSDMSCIFVARSLPESG